MLQTLNLTYVTGFLTELSNMIYYYYQQLKKPLYLYSYEKPQLLASDGFIEREVIAREIASNRISCYIIYLYCSERKDAVFW